MPWPPHCALIGRQKTNDVFKDRHAVFQRLSAVGYAKPCSCVNRGLTGEERALVWRFRWSLVGEPAALTRVLQCVDWSDALEARQAGELMTSWAPIAAAQALELLSPAFPQPEVQQPFLPQYLCPHP